jgi:hypothetical protein
MYRDTKWSNSIPIFPVDCIECIFDSVNSVWRWSSYFESFDAIIQLPYTYI